MKEGMRFQVNYTTFRCVPKLFVKRMVSTATRNLNNFLAENGSLDTLGPLSIAKVSPSADEKMHPMDFGSCAEIFGDNGGPITLTNLD